MVSSEIARQVSAAADALGYRPNPIAYGLKTNRSFTVGVLVPDLTNPVFPPIIRGIEDTLGAKGYTAILANCDNDAARERNAVDIMRGRQVDGLILATAHRDDPLIAACADDDLPLVLINRTVDNSAAASVVTDDIAGIGMIVAHLLARGHRRIAHVGGPQTLSTGFNRAHGMAQAMQRAGLSADPELTVFCDAFTEHEGRRGCERLLRRGHAFTAIVAGNDLLAIGCYDALAAHGLGCPADISVTGFNDMPFVDRLSPPLTTVRIPHYEMGAMAARSLIERIERPNAPVRAVRLEPLLVVRGSTAPAVSRARHPSRGSR